MAVREEGYIVISEEEYFNRAVELFKQYYPNMSTQPSNILMILARLFAKTENIRDYDTANAISNAYIATAFGASLDKVVRTAGIFRIQGLPSYGKVKIKKETNVAQVVIPPNMRILSNNLSYITQNKNAIILNNDEIEVEIKSDSTGSIYNIPIGSTFNPFQSIFGIKEIKASMDISGGKPEETDAELRLRYMDRMETTYNSSLVGILSALARVDGVVKVDGKENKTDRIVDGLLPHSYIAYVKGGTDTDIALTLNNVAPAGIQSNGGVSIDVGGNTYKFSRFKETDAFYKGTIVIDKQATDVDIIKSIKKAISEFTTNNNRIISYELNNYISQSVDGVKGIRILNFGLSKNPTSNTDLIAKDGYIFTTQDNDIEIEVVK